MDLKDILSVAIASLLVLVVAHVVVFWVVRTLYPPFQQVPIPMPAPLPPQPPQPPQQQVFTQPPVEEQTVHVPTHEAPIQLEAAREEGSANFPFNTGAPAQRESGLAAAHSG